MLIDGIAHVLASGGGPLGLILMIERLFLLKQLIIDTVAKEVELLFNQAIKNARLTGKLVAVALALGYPFSTQTVSLLGFSLGTQVIKSCLKTLRLLGADDIVHNVTMLGGATHYEKNQMAWEAILSSTVGGKIRNVHSDDDLILKLFTLS